MAPEATSVCWRAESFRVTTWTSSFSDATRRDQMHMARSRALRASSLHTPTDLDKEAVREISAALTAMLADFFALYLKTKNFHWHVSGPHFRDYHLLLDEQGEQIFAATDDIAER